MLTPRLVDQTCRIFPPRQATKDGDGKRITEIGSPWRAEAKEAHGGHTKEGRVPLSDLAVPLFPCPQQRQGQPRRLQHLEGQRQGMTSQGGNPLNPRPQQLQVPGLNQSGTPLWERLRDCLPWWKKAGATTEVLELICQGVQADFPLPAFLSRQIREKPLVEIQSAQRILREYQQAGATKMIHASEAKHFVPYFILTKKEGDKVKERLISDCRELNQFFNPKKFRLEHMGQILPHLRKGWFCGKIDLKDAYFHLGLHQNLQSYVCMQVGEETWQFTGACFGISTLPQKFMMLMRVWERKWRKEGKRVFIYLDDILLLAPSRKTAKSQLGDMQADLENAGFKINVSKSTLEPTQSVKHLGQWINLKDGQLEIPPEKLKSVRKELGKIVTAKSMSCRKLSSILGQVRSFLVSAPFLRLLTDKLCKMVNLHTVWGWDHILSIPEEVRGQVVELKAFLQPGVGRAFPSKPTRELFSDSSTWAWGGLDSQSGRKIQDFWRARHVLHINQKELFAAVETVKALAKPKETVVLHVDNQVAFSYLNKWGGRKPYLNNILKPLLYWCREKKITLQVDWVPSADQLADKLTRERKDPGDYTLNVNVFQAILQFFKGKISPAVDMFCTPSNAKFPKFCCRYPHQGALLVDALKTSLVGLSEVYANPPWSIIPHWTHRLVQNPNVICLLVVPYWVSTSWWRQLMSIRKPKEKILLVPPRQGLFQNCWGEDMPPPRWPLACLIASGSYYNAKKFKFQTSTLT